MDLSSLLKYEGMTLEIVIWSLFIGILLGVGGSLYVKRVLGAFVRKLLEVNADSPESAKTLGETGFEKNYFVINALRDKGTVRRMVQLSLPEGEAVDSSSLSPKEERKLIKRARWYINTEHRYRAEVMFDAKGNSVFIMLVAIAAFLIAALISFTVIPDLVSMASSAFSSFGA